MPYVGSAETPNRTDKEGIGVTGSPTEIDMCSTGTDRSHVQYNIGRVDLVAETAETVWLLAKMTDKYIETYAP